MIRRTINYREKWEVKNKYGAVTETAYNESRAREIVSGLTLLYPDSAPYSVTHVTPEEQTRRQEEEDRARAELVEKRTKLREYADSKFFQFSEDCKGVVIQDVYGGCCCGDCSISDSVVEFTEQDKDAWMKIMKYAKDIAAGLYSGK